VEPTTLGFQLAKEIYYFENKLENGNPPLSQQVEPIAVEKEKNVYYRCHLSIRRVRWTKGQLTPWGVHRNFFLELVEVILTCLKYM
jgi:hypothetical protein